MRQLTSKRTQAIGPSATLQVAKKARELRATGVDVVDFGPGEPDFDTPDHIVHAGIDALRNGFTHYVPSRGIPQLLEAIANKLRAENNIVVDPQTDIIVCPGGKQALYEVIMATIDPGDEVVIFDPAWVSYDPIVRLAGGTPVRVGLSYDDNFTITAEKLSAGLSRRTKAIILNSPSNPTGRILTRDELRVVADAAMEHDLLVVSDEMYEKLVFEGHANLSPAALDGMSERTVTCSGFSKSYAMTGWRLGFAAGPAHIMKEALKVHEHSVTCATSFVQCGGVVAYEGTQEPIQYMVSQFAGRREIISDGLNSLPGVETRKPEGSFYVFPRIAGTGMSSTEFADRMLQEAHVALTPGIAFGEAGEGHVRLSFATSIANIQRGIEQMRAALSK